MRITSYGAAGTVTGSCHLLDITGTRLLVDCGMFQGEEQITTMNYESKKINKLSRRQPTPYR